MSHKNNTGLKKPGFTAPLLNGGTFGNSNNIFLKLWQVHRTITTGFLRNLRAVSFCKRQFLLKKKNRDVRRLETSKCRVIFHILYVVIKDVALLKHCVVHDSPYKCIDSCRNDKNTRGVTCR